MIRVRHFIQLCFWAILLGTTPKAYASSPIFQEQQADSAILFRFVPGKLTFYAPFRGNEQSILDAEALIERNRDLITQGKAWVVVRGYCGSYPTREENLRAAKNRSNQVKSWFITHHGMKEEYYRTGNSTQTYRGMKDVVAIMSIMYAPGYDPAETARLEAERKRLEQLRADSLAALEAARLEAERLEAERRRAEADSLAAAQAAAEQAAQAQPERVYVATPWYIKSNLLYDAVLMPSLEVEYRFNENWSAAVEGNMAWWHNDGKHKYYQLATIIPEVRWWFKPQGERRGHYVGLFGGGGWYDLENGGTGYKGTGGMVGISYGYMFPVGKYFAFEAGAGVGYLHTKYEEYYPMDGHYAYQQTSRTNFFGPLKLKFAFVWNIGRWLEKGGNK